jgi:hypothetical protein
MGYRTILVCLNEVNRAAALLQVAGGIAQTHEAHLIGLFVIPGLRIYPASGMGMTPELFEAHREMFTGRSEEAKALFDAQMRETDLLGEWRLVESGSPLVADTAIEHARQSDLVVASQSSPESDSGVESDFAGRIAMESGRPILLVQPESSSTPTWSTAEVAHHALHGEELRIIGFRDVHAAGLVEPDHEVEEVHRIEIQRLAHVLVIGQDRRGLPPARCRRAPRRRACGFRLPS